MTSAVGSIIGGVGSIVGGAMGSSSASSAAKAQQKAAQQAAELQKDIYGKNTANFQPYLDAGNSGLQALMYRLGLGTGTSGGRVQTEQEIRNELRGQYTTGANPGGPPSLQSLGLSPSLDARWGYDAQKQKWGYEISGYTGGDAGMPYSYWKYADPTGSTGESVDEAGLNAAVQARLAQQQADQAARQSDPIYGSLLSSYKEYKPFSETDFKADPGYQFRLDQGNKAIQNLAAATGNLNSGRALKDAMNFSSGLASQEYQNAYGRYNNDYRTGFDSFTANQSNAFNKLAALAGIGQTSASSLANAGQNYANQTANALGQGANAQAAGQIGSSNALGQGIAGAANSLGGYFANQAVSPIRGSGYSGYAPGSTSALGSFNGLSGW